MSTTENKFSIYQDLSKNMQKHLSKIPIPKKSSNEKYLIDSIHNAWNKTIKEGSRLYESAKKDLKYSTFLKMLKYDIKIETLKKGKKILREVKKHRFTDHEARKKQRVFIEELEDRLDFISSRY